MSRWLDQHDAPFEGPRDVGAEEAPRPIGDQRLHRPTITARPTGAVAALTPSRAMVFLAAHVRRSTAARGDARGVRARGPRRAGGHGHRLPRAQPHHGRGPRRQGGEAGARGRRRAPRSLRARDAPRRRGRTPQRRARVRALDGGRHAPPPDGAHRGRHPPRAPPRAGRRAAAARPRRGPGAGHPDLRRGRRAAPAVGADVSVGRAARRRPARRRCRPRPGVVCPPGGGF